MNKLENKFEIINANIKANQLQIELVRLFCNQNNEKVPLLRGTKQWHFPCLNYSSTSTGRVSINEITNCIKAVVSLSSIEPSR